MLEQFFSWIISFTSSLGYFGIILAMAIESTVIPLPSELILLPAGYLVYKGTMNIYLLIICAVFGSIIGSFFSYWLGEKLGRPFVEKHKSRFFLNDEKIKKIDLFFERFGASSIFFARLIIGVRHFISFFAGFAKENKKKFIIYTFIGAGLWNTFLICLGYFLGTQEAIIKTYLSYFTVVIIAIVCLVIIIYLFKHLTKRKNKKK